MIKLQDILKEVEGKCPEATQDINLNLQKQLKIL